MKKANKDVNFTQKNLEATLSQENSFITHFYLQIKSFSKTIKSKKEISLKFRVEVGVLETLCQKLFSEARKEIDLILNQPQEEYRDSHFIKRLLGDCSESSNENSNDTSLSEDEIVCKLPLSYEEIIEILTKTERIYVSLVGMLHNMVFTIAKTESQAKNRKTIPIEYRIANRMKNVFQLFKDAQSAWENLLNMKLETLVSTNQLSRELVVSLGSRFLIQRNFYQNFTSSNISYHGFKRNDKIEEIDSSFLTSNDSDPFDNESSCTSFVKSMLELPEMKSTNFKFGKNKF